MMKEDDLLLIFSKNDQKITIDLWRFHWPWDCIKNKVNGKLKRSLRALRGNFFDLIGRVVCRIRKEIDKFIYILNYDSSLSIQIKIQYIYNFDPGSNILLFY